jgi:hypothetical protein
MCKEMPVILVKTRWWAWKESSEKMEGQGGGEAQGVIDPTKDIVSVYVKYILLNLFSKMYSYVCRHLGR